MSPSRRSSAVALLAVIAAATACGGGSNNVASHSPSPGHGSAPASPSPTASPSASPSAQPIAGAYGVLISSQAASTYTVSIVGVDGKVVASATASTPSVVSCAGSAAALVANPISTSNSRLYFMDAQGIVRFLGPNGDTGQTTTVPAGSSSRRSMFAVSPDDQRIAVIVDDFTSGGASTRLYVEDLSGGGNHLDLFTESGAYSLWPVGWHGTNNLVLAKVPACTQGGGPFCCGPQELHVVDPATANRRFILGGPVCVIAGPPSPAGVVCENRPDFATGAILNWTAGTVRSLAFNGPAASYLSPAGGMTASVDNNGTTYTIGAGAMPGFFACGWIDEDHVFSGGDTLHQPRVVAPVSDSVVPVAAQGDCGGRIPGGL